MNETAASVERKTGQSSRRYELRDQSTDSQLHESPPIDRDSPFSLMEAE
jgi:hypothetical protein